MLLTDELLIALDDELLLTAELLTALDMTLLLTDELLTALEDTLLLDDELLKEAVDELLLGTGPPAPPQAASVDANNTEPARRLRDTGWRKALGINIIHSS